MRTESRQEGPLRPLVRQQVLWKTMNSRYRQPAATTSASREWWRISGDLMPGTGLSSRSLSTPFITADSYSTLHHTWFRVRFSVARLIPVNLRKPRRPSWAAHRPRASRLPVEFAPCLLPLVARRSCTYPIAPGSRGATRMLASMYRARCLFDLFHSFSAWPCRSPRTARGLRTSGRSYLGRLQQSHPAPFLPTPFPSSQVGRVHLPAPAEV
jgi:hypothetical protein